MTNLPQFARFVMVGVLALGVNIVVTYLLTEFIGLWYFWSFCLGTLASWTFLFFANASFTFGGSNVLKVQNYTVFIGIYALAFIFNAALVLLLTSSWDVYYPLSIAIAAAFTTLVTFNASKKFVYTVEHGWIHRIVRDHWHALLLALVAALIVFAPNVMLWLSPEYQGVEIMMLDAENHYFARVHQVYEGDIAIRDTFLPTEKVPYATPPLGEIIVAFFGKIVGLDAARAAIVSKPLSVGAIVLLLYALAFSLSRSKPSALLAAAVPVFGYSLISLSPQPFMDLFTGNSTAGPFIFFSRLVNTSISSLFLFGGLLLIYRTLFQKLNLSWRSMLLIGILIGASLYISPYTFSFLGALLFLVFVWFVWTREYTIARYAFLAGVIALLCTIPFILNTIALHALPGYTHLAQFLGLVERREFVLGLLLPLMMITTALFWPRRFLRSGGTFLLLTCAALVLVLNQQILTGIWLHPGHYHWYITKPLAGLLAGLFAGYLIERFVSERFVRGTVVVVLAVLVYNSFGFFAPWYLRAQESISKEQRYGPLVTYLATLPEQEVVWAEAEASDFIPIYTKHGSPNSVNLGSYPISQEYFDNRIFLEYRLRGVAPKDFEKTIRLEVNHVSGWLWGLWLRELTGDPNAVPEEEYTRLVRGYAEFHKRSWDEVFDALHVTMVVAEAPVDYSSIPALREVVTIGNFTVYELKN